MKITIENDGCVNFSDLEVGEVFFHVDTAYVKIWQLGKVDKINALCLQDSNLHSINKESKVLRCKEAELIIKR